MKEQQQQQNSNDNKNVSKKNRSLLQTTRKEEERVLGEQSTRIAGEGSMSEGAPEEKLEEKEHHLKKKREQAKAKRMQETVEEREAHLDKARERARAKRMQETAEEGGMSQKEKGTSTGQEDARTPEEAETHLKNRREQAQARRMQETPQQKEVHLEKGKPKRMEETAQEKEAGLAKAQKKRETKIQQKICESKGFIEDEQQWLITGSLHKPAEFTNEEDRKKFESQVESPPGVKEPDGVRPSIFYKSELAAGDSQDRDKNGCHYLGKMDVVCGYCGGKGFRAEIDSYFTSSDKKKLPHFGRLCCCHGCVTQSTKIYNLPQ